MVKVLSSNLGYPRLGEKREWKKSLENFWNNKISEDTLLSETKGIRFAALNKQKEKGIDLIPVNDFTLYDHVLDLSVGFGVIPKRFGEFTNAVSLRTYFDIARGNDTAVASEMTKWFNTNYHYIVPELDQVEPKLLENKALNAYLEAKEELGIDGKPVIVGPITYLKLGKGADKADFASLVEKFVPLYKTIIEELDAAGAKWIQLDEPILATSLAKEELALFEKVYEELRTAAPHAKLILQTYFESVDEYEAIIKLPVDAIGLDFIHDHGESLEKIQQYGFPNNKYLAAGIIDGRNVWRADIQLKQAELEILTRLVPKEKIIVQPASSLLHVPVTKKK
ncbi:5-methyltetrahydropteroyltriglutamate--homocysteine S-methyltransferase [Listeria fleischmannii FSL S10-1203]|uniref:5-methyltetrahydropteroyltriglutamate--homocysteine S-methyltransferase n=1 Tax=Listeria fleischmannii FSL S10-1203 TaxID=1265822 RepID=W7E0T0_9LIST|nr:5-methyltetrahydropteroyltriglutamate--homocysteine S-methyltransferase [Listeria fleischmannii FSL S10-1203]